jgi:hypothetical protein
MSNRCFSSSQLYALRNQINVQMLIEKTLSIPCRMAKGCFRFLCPLCNRFDTAVNPKTNLGRCFRCEKNFNTIDLVMLIRQVDFVHSVKFLQSIHQKDDQDQNRHDPMVKSGSNQQAAGRMKLKTPPEKSDSGPCPIGEVLDSVLPPIDGGISENRADLSKSNTPMTVGQITVEDRIVKLEQQLEYLDDQVKKIAGILDVGLTSK